MRRACGVNRSCPPVRARLGSARRGMAGSFPANYFARMKHTFPIARAAWAFATRARADWLERHQSGFNFWVHMVGIPLALAGVVLLFAAEWPWGVGSLAGGYLLQWVGHRAEGNDVGEFIPVKRLLGLPVTAVAPRYAKVQN